MGGGDRPTPMAWGWSLDAAQDLRMESDDIEIYIGANKDKRHNSTVVS